MLRKRAALWAQGEFRGGEFRGEFRGHPTQPDKWAPGSIDVSRWMTAKPTTSWDDAPCESSLRSPSRGLRRHVEPPACANACQPHRCWLSSPPCSAPVRRARSLGPRRPTAPTMHPETSSASQRAAGCACWPQSPRRLSATRPRRGDSARAARVSRANRCMPPRWRFRPHSPDPTAPGRHEAARTRRPLRGRSDQEATAPVAPAVSEDARRSTRDPARACPTPRQRAIRRQSRPRRRPPACTLQPGTGKRG